ncbi:radical activating enzyme [Clostridiaceae bacterium JG1575]|nr:radical activating enzyme [Clostridiaceae bacterium JG1575]
MTYCEDCPRACRAQREKTLGFCLAPCDPIVAKTMLHHWEEPFLCDLGGSGAVFFSGCSLRCVFCQNEAISRTMKGQRYSPEELCHLFFDLAQKGAQNINLVTGTHFVRPIAKALRLAKEQGLDLPVVWNSSGYETVKSLQQLAGLIDIYLPDMKYLSPELAGRFSGAPDYPSTAQKALQEMFRQVGPCRFNNEELRSGLVVRHLVLPECNEDSKKILAWLYKTFGDDIYLSIMNQYTPPSDRLLPAPLHQRLRQEEYDEVVAYAMDLGITNALIQEASSQSSDFTPDF